MALLMQESFDFYASTASLLNSAWTRATGSLSFPGGRRSSRAASVSGYATGLTYWISYNLPVENTGVIWWGFAFAQEALAGVNTEWIRVKSAAPASGNQFTLDITAAGRVRVKVSAAGAVLAESADGAIKLDGTFQFIEIGFQCAASASVAVWVNGVSVLSGNALNLRQSGAGGCGRLVCGSPANNVANAAFYDDMYLLDTTGDAPFNARLGDYKVDAHLFTADDDVEWASTEAAHHDSINVVGANYAVDYIESDGVGEQDSFAITPGDMTTIQAVELVAYCRNPGGGTAKCKPFVKIDSTIYYGDEVTLPADTCNKRSYVWLLNPAGDPDPIPWTKAVVTDATFGWETTVLA